MTVPANPSADNRGSAVTAALIGLVGGGCRIAALWLPWVTAEGPGGKYSAGGFDVGLSALSIAFAGGIVLASLMCLRGSNLQAAQWILGLGIGALLASVVNFFNLNSLTNDLRSSLSAAVGVHVGVGIWVQALGALLAIIGGGWAARLVKSMRPAPQAVPWAPPASAEPPTPPPRPDEPGQ